MSAQVFDAMIGKTFTSLEGGTGSGEMIFTADTGDRFRFTHFQDCCERVVVEDICGELSDLLNSPITLAEETTEAGDQGESQTWTFYRIGTAKGMVTIRWNGQSNGYYSERVSFCEVKK